MKNDIHWWQNGVIYQIYPRSFQDSTGNGIGDINGITRRLDYLQWLGVSAIWLTPIYSSPQIDNGYDVADYYDIDPLFGTMEDFDNLIAAAHERQIKVVMDMVFNHTSTQHAWFKSAAGDRLSPWRDFYIWRDGKGALPPNNWHSKFGGSAWQWHEESQQYYLHSFSPEQADLNWENPDVRNALKAVCHFWADKGIDGLRLDVINLVSKHPDLPDDHEGDGRRFYTDGPAIHDFLEEMSRDVFQPRGLMTVGEMSSTQLAHCQRYARLDGKELSMTFNFHHLKIDYDEGKKWNRGTPDRVHLKKIFAEWQRGMHGLAWNALFWCNHDQPRIVSRLGDDGPLREVSAKMLAMVLHGMQGTPYIFQGEEIGMTDPHFKHIDHYRDVESLNIYQTLIAGGISEEHVLAILEKKSRDNSRTPVQWDNSVNAGFTSGKSWIDVAGNYDVINVEQERLNEQSVLNTYRRLIALRKSLPVLTLGDYTDMDPLSERIWCYKREDKDNSLLVLANLTPDTVAIDDYFGEEERWRLLYGNYDSTQNSVDSLRPYECMWWIK
ncbi:MULTISPECIES: alpha,alpha-phosphotrehalase [unclassified Pseudescherichia]|jgi:trehalose-6-phosphate hydrolase|uniref:alpha,alpha-phosphotrehalase n=1 Tax=Pseudescherichia TaxID=2055880 RepID=UPI00214F7311|nr:MULTISPECIES: alpha,alpha-phosphotrehalase [unclassified Pseudescherichia]MCR4457512.1 alpha,alpha-phosphotrehalase [Pseudescherichia sp. L3]MDF2776489.1 treC [Enterobacteriaceae bacterium]WPO97178.1 alpha,alpha-phosphotrehalase [Buttiauxella sp. HR94]